MVRRALGIASPSKVLKKLGVYAIQGFQAGFASISGKSMVQDLTQGLMSVPANVRASVDLSSVKASAGSSSGTVNVSINVSADATTDTVALGKKLISAMQDAYAATGRPVRIGVA